jgi:hypothetical protein
MISSYTPSRDLRDVSEPIKCLCFADISMNIPAKESGLTTVHGWKY